MEKIVFFETVLIALIGMLLYGAKLKPLFSKELRTKNNATQKTSISLDTKSQESH